MPTPYEVTGQASVAEVLTWTSTGSSWADDRVNIAGIRFQVEPSALSQDMQLEFKNKDSIIIYQRISATDTIFYVEDIKLDVPYTLHLDAAEPTAFTATVVGVLPVKRD